MTNPFTALQDTLNTTDEVTAAYVGVPITTWRKWANGIREANTAGVRLIEVLGIIRTMAPQIHEHLMKQAIEQVKMSRGVK